MVLPCFSVFLAYKICKMEIRPTLAHQAPLIIEGAAQIEDIVILLTRTKRAILSVQ